MPSSLQTSVTCLLLLTCLYETATAQSRLCGRALADTLDMVCAGRGFHLGKRSVRSIPHLEGNHIGSNTGPFAVHDSSYNRLRPVRVPEGSNLEEKRSHSILSILKPRLDSEESGLKSEAATGSGASTSSLSSVSLPGKDTNGVPAVAGQSWQALPQVGAGEETRGLKQVAVVEERTRRSTTSVVDECCLQACTFATLESYCAASSEPVEMLSMEELRRRLGLSVAHATPPPWGQGRPAPRPRPSAEIIRNGGRNGSGPFFYLQFGNQATRSPLVD